MPNLAHFHPQIVHFVVVFMFVGVAFRLVSLTGRLQFTNHAAATLLIAGAIAGLLAARSGLDAHGPVERIPGVRNMVSEHEEDGILVHRIFAVIGLIELGALGLARRQSLARYGRYAHMASALVGIVGCVMVYEASEHGGQLVYSYAGGPGLRTGRAEDVERLLLAGLYNQSRNDRRDGKLVESAALNAEMARRWPADTTIQFLMVESLLLDSKNPAAAQAALRKIALSEGDARWRARQVGLAADIFLAMGQRDSARAVLTTFVGAFPQNARLKARLDSLQ